MATLIESLTALAIFATGASASATWLAQSTAGIEQAGARLKALALATDMEARLRANPQGVLSGAYQYAIPAAFDCRRGCTYDNLAAADLAAFHAGVANALGDAASGSMGCAGGVCSIRIRWPGGVLDWGVGP